jgi:hypothetical protein
MARCLVKQRDFTFMRNTETIFGNILAERIVDGRHRRVLDTWADSIKFEFGVTAFIVPDQTSCLSGKHFCFIFGRPQF